MIFLKDAKLRKKLHQVNFCVIGGGMAGLLAAISAARHGSKVVLMQDRPVLGGNASSEIRMWIRGAGLNNRETGILEEIALENRYRNPDRNYSIWDSILFEKAKFEPNLTLLLNCSCNDLKMSGKRIKSIKGWQLTTYTWHEVEAEIFADCSGDSILAPLSGAEYMIGREAQNEFQEDIAPVEADDRTMGLTCLLQARETDKYQEFIAPEWAYNYESDKDLPERKHDLYDSDTNFWWLELGGNQDTIHDTENIRDELLKLAFGVWDHIKNKGGHGADNWKLDWVGFLPGKRESRRYVGEHILTQNDIMKEGKFNDIVAYGGWPMDDHDPDGFNHSGEPCAKHPTPSPYGIPYRCLYSSNIKNLMFAGRNISATHAAMSSTRVMATCAIIGQAVGTAAALAVQNQLTPGEIDNERIVKLQQMLMDDDCYLPWLKRDIAQLTVNANLTASEGDPEPLRNGIDRPVAGEDNGWIGSPDSWIQYSFSRPEDIKELRFVFDSDLTRETCTDNTVMRKHAMICNRTLGLEKSKVPSTLVKKFKIKILDEAGNWQEIVSRDNNYQRLVKIKTEVVARAVQFIPKETWGSENVHLYAWDVS